MSTSMERRKTMLPQREYAKRLEPRNALHDSSLEGKVEKSIVKLAGKAGLQGSKAGLRRTLKKALLSPPI